MLTSFAPLSPSQERFFHILLNLVRADRSRLQSPAADRLHE